MATVLKQRLKTLLKDCGETARAISMRATGKPDTIRDIMRRTKSPQAETIRKLAGELGVSSAYLSGETNVRNSRSSHDSDAVLPARVIGLVQAGAFMEADADVRFEIEPEWVPSVKDPEFPNLQQIAYRIAGDSVDKKCEDGGYAICLPFPETGLDIKQGMWVVATRTRGSLVERTIKRVQGVPGRFTLHPSSTNPKHQPIAFPSAEKGEEITIVALVRRFMGPTLPH